MENQQKSWITDASEFFRTDTHSNLFAHFFFVEYDMICITQIALLISNLLHLHMLNASQWAVLSSSSIKPSCQNQTCGPTRPTHSYCLPRKPDKIITPACRRFKHFHRLRIRDTSIRKIVDGHNGLRNRVALNYWQPASNMKLLHWDKDLQRMAEGWLAQCQLDKQDECDYLCISYHFEFSWSH